VAISGKQPETSEPGKTAFAHLGVSALEKTLIIVQALKELDEERGRRVRHPALDKAVGRSTNLLIGHLRAGEQGQSTQVPVNCILEASLTFPPNEYLPAVQKEVERLSRKPRPVIPGFVKTGPESSGSSAPRGRDPRRPPPFPSRVTIDQGSDGRGAIRQPPPFRQ